jgi:hypothetical protein
MLINLLAITCEWFCLKVDRLIIEIFQPKITVTFTYKIKTDEFMFSTNL